MAIGRLTKEGRICYTRNYFKMCRSADAGLPASPVPLPPSHTAWEKGGGEEAGTSARPESEKDQPMEELYSNMERPSGGELC